MGKDIPRKHKQKTEIAILISKEFELITRNTISDIEGCYIMIKWIVSLRRLCKFQICMHLKIDDQSS